MSEDLLQRKISRLSKIMKQEKEELHTSTFDNLDSYRDDIPISDIQRNKKSQLTFRKEIIWNIIIRPNVKYTR